MNPTQRRRRSLRAMAMLMTAGLVLSACSTGSSSAAPGSAAAGSAAAGSAAAGNAAGMKIFMVPKFTGLAYFEVARVGGEKAGKELGIDFQYIGSDKPLATEEIATLQNAIPQKPAALVVSAIDGDAVAPILRQARTAGIKVVTYDADAAVDSRDLFINQLSYELAASTMLDAALLN